MTRRSAETIGAASVVATVTELGYSIISSDAFLVACNKTSGLLSVPGIGPEKADCLVARLQTEFPGVRIVHRLDRDTSGVIVLARDAATHRALSIAFQDRMVTKTYEALVAGHVELDAGEVNLPLRKEGAHAGDCASDSRRRFVCSWCSAACASAIVPARELDLVRAPKHASADAV